MSYDVKTTNAMQNFAFISQSIENDIIEKSMKTTITLHNQNKKANSVEQATSDATTLIVSYLSHRVAVLVQKEITNFDGATLASCVREAVIREISPMLETLEKSNFMKKCTDYAAHVKKFQQDKSTCLKLITSLGESELENLNVFLTESEYHVMSESWDVQTICTFIENCWEEAESVREEFRNRVAERLKIFKPSNNSEYKE